MTEVAGLLIPADHRLTTVRKYEAGPPKELDLVEPGETIATTKEEEWVSKKKTEIVNTKQIETRVKRQVVLEDGKVVEDSGPQVTTNTTEDTETQEHHQTELRKLGPNQGEEDDDEEKAAIDAVDGPADKNGELVEKSRGKWVLTANPDGVVREVKEKRVVSREETEEVRETEDVQHYGDITDEDFLSAVNTGQAKIGPLLRQASSALPLVSTGPRLVHESTKSSKTIDTENKRDTSSVLPNGKIVTESERTTEHEEIKDEELPDAAPVPLDSYKESRERYVKTRNQEDVDYVADGVKIAHEMRFRTETMEMERDGDGNLDDFDSLSTRMRRQRQMEARRRLEAQQQPTAAASPLDRKDALTRRPLDFDQEEETRKVETSKWLEHHFGSESRSSSNSLADEDADERTTVREPPKTSFFNVTIKSQQVDNKSGSFSKPPMVTRVYSPVEPERDPPVKKYTAISPPTSRISSNVNNNNYYKGISQWSERHVQQQQQAKNYHRAHQKSPVPDYAEDDDELEDEIEEEVPIRDVTPTPPQRKRASERRHQQHVVQEKRYGNSIMRNGGGGARKPLDEPPPDYSPPAATASENRKAGQKTRFAPDPPKAKSGNIIGQSIRKLVGKIRSASAERKAKQRAKRSPSPSYQKGHVIDSNIGAHHHHHGNNMENRQQPVQRYYLGEDPFAGSIYGRENKYDGVVVTKTRPSRRPHDDQARSQSTLGRFSKSTSRLVNTSGSAQGAGSSQTLPRHLNRHPKSDKSNSTINVSIINTVSSPLVGPAKPARTYKSNLSRSKSLNVHNNMYTSSPHLNRLEEKQSGLKSPGLISSLSRSQKDLSDGVTASYSSRFGQRNGVDVTNNNNNVENKKIFMKGLKDRAPELFKTLHENEEGPYSSGGYRTSTIIKQQAGKHSPYSGDIYEPPTRLMSTSPPPAPVRIRRGSNSSTDYSETYHTTTRNDDPLRPSVTNTVKSFTKKTIPTRDGRGVETIESSETKSVTKSHYRGGSSGGGRSESPSVKFYENERRYGGSGAASPVVIEVRSASSNSFRK